MTLGRIGAITFIQTSDLDRALAYYRDTLGLTHVTFDGFAHVFDLDGAVLRLTHIPGWKGGPYPALGWRVSDIVAAMATLKGKGTEFLIYPGMGQDEAGLWTAPGGDARVCWFNDPDGNLLSLTEHG